MILAGRYIPNVCLLSYRPISLAHTLAWVVCVSYTFNSNWFLQEIYNENNGRQHILVRIFSCVLYVSVSFLNPYILLFRLIVYSHGAKKRKTCDCIWNLPPNTTVGFMLSSKVNFQWYLWLNWCLLVITSLVKILRTLFDCGIRKVDRIIRKLVLVTRHFYIPFHGLTFLVGARKMDVILQTHFKCIFFIE